jgi:hypothetical protein
VGFNARKLLDWKTLFIYLHRWMGIAFGVVFVVWFISGVAMMYVGMPHLSDKERLGHVPLLDLSTMRVSPAAAARAHDLTPERLSVEMHSDGRPIYRFGATTVYADTGELVPGADRAAAVATIQRWVPAAYATTVRYDARLTDSDQWTLYNDQRSRMPLHRVSVGDPAGTVYYVSEKTGEPTMKTDRRGRVLGYVSAVLHWTYFTSFRRNGPLWQQVVGWGATVGAVMALLGLVVGVFRTRVTTYYRLRSGPSHSPYVGWMKWHHYTGLFFGVLSITWALSGAMSLGRPFTSLRNGPPTPSQRMAVPGTPLDLEQVTIERMRAGLNVVARSFAPKALDVLQFRGEPYLIGRRPPAAYVYEEEIGANEERYEPRPEHRIVSVLAPERGAFTRFPAERMWDVAKAAMPGVPVRDAVWLQEYDAYYYNQDGNRPLPVLRVRYADADATSLYLDPNLGTMMRQDWRGRWNRWLYHGLHNLDFPVLYYQRPLWDVVMIVLSAGGLALSVTTLVPSWRRLMRHARRLRPAFAGSGGRTAVRPPAHAVRRDADARN